MSPMAYKYKAFVSYKHTHQDAKWAKWLVDAIESYQVPKALITPERPKRLGKLFRDKDEGHVTHDLNQLLKDALDDSEYLIVVCSPAAKEAPLGATRNRLLSSLRSTR